MASVVKVRILINKEQDPLTQDGNVQKDTIEPENSKPSLKVLSYLKKSPLSADVLSSAPPEILSFTPLTEEISHVLSAKSAMTFF